MVHPSCKEMENCSSTICLGRETKISGSIRRVLIEYKLPLLHIVVQSLSGVCLFATPRTAACQAPLFSTISQNFLKFMSIESVMLSNHLILWHTLLLLHSIFPSIRSFPMSWLFTPGGQNIGASALVTAQPMNIQGWFHGKISLAVQGTLKSLLSYKYSYIISQKSFSKTLNVWQ